MGRNSRNNGKKAQMNEATAKGIAREAEQEELIFADENAKVAWEVGQAVDQISASLPPESPSLKAKTITFEPENISRGTYAVFFSGTVIGTDREGVLTVPERSLQILERLGIPYTVV